MALSDHTNLEAHWKLNEESGTRVDSHGANDLADVNTVLFGTGKLGNAADFEADNAEELTIADNASLSMGDIDFTFTGWANLESKGDLRFILGKDLSVNPESYHLSFENLADRFRFRVRSSGGEGNVNADNLGSPSLATWYFIVAWHDATANTINIQVNDGTVDSVSFTAGSYDGTGTFYLGANNDGGKEWDGLLDSWSVWKRVLTAQERTDLYNGGAGLDYPFTVAVGHGLLLGNRRNRLVLA